jgi:MEMO1 family protein
MDVTTSEQYPVPDRPNLRPVEVHPVDTENGTSYALSDPLQIAPNSIVLSAGAIMILQRTDGQSTIPDIQAAIFRDVGQMIETEILQSFFTTLDEALFLDSPRFRDAFDTELREFESMDIRPPVLAGEGYPSDPDELKGFLDAFLSDVGEPETTSQEIQAAVIPHIDLRVGGIGFAHAYKGLAGSTADVFVVLGIAHHGDGHPFYLTEKHFDTPLGVVPTDRDFVARLRTLVPEGSLGSELPHRREHSIEFQTLLLRHVFAHRDIEIVPILCGGTPYYGKPDAIVSGFHQALRQTIDESERRICVLASVDFSHVGRRFADQNGITPERLREIEHEDLALLDAFARWDAPEFHQLIVRDENKRNVCGYPALSTLLDVVTPNGPGQLLDYRQSVEEDTDSVVTFAAMTFT